MSNWYTAPLPETLEFREGPGIMAADFHDEGVPLIRLAGLKRGSSLLTGCNYLDPTKVQQKWKQFRLQEGDVLLSTSASLGEVARVGQDGVGAIPYTGIIYFRPKDERVDPSFVQHMLTVPSFKAQIEAMGVGSVMKHFGPSHLRQMTVSFPDLSTQQEISTVLAALDDKIAANDKLVAFSDGLAEAFFTKALGDSTVPLTSEALVTMGSSPPGTSYNECGGGAPFYQGVRDFGVRFPRKRIWTNSPVRMARVDDTLVSVRAPVGRTNLANEDLCIGRGIASLRSRSGFPMTLFHQVRAARDAWAPYEAEGTVFGSINKKQLEAISLPSIRTELAGQLEHELVNIERRIAAALAENEALAVNRDKLLPLLMSGKVRVRGAENVVSDAL